MTATYEIIESGSYHVVMCDGRQIAQCRSREAAERVIADREGHIALNAAQSAAEAQESRRLEAAQSEIDRRLRERMQYTTSYRGTRTSNRGHGGPNVEFGIATFADGYRCQYEWDNDGRHADQLYPID